MVKSILFSLEQWHQCDDLKMCGFWPTLYFVSEEEVLERWREHIISALNHRPGAPSDELDNEAVSAPVDTSVSTDEPLD